MDVRRASADDAEAVARVHLRTWQTAYRHVFPPETLDELPLGPRIRGWTEAFSDPDGDGFVAGDPIVGFVFVRESEEEPGVGEVEAIYVDPDEWGAGVGRALLAAGEAALRERGFDEGLLWVLEDNPRTRRFYELAGWEDDGGRQLWPRYGVEPTVARYRKQLVD
jgi:ribosomal protein S18 acetylase RimI-like enzyme